jgi:competence protein ComGC
LHKEQQLLSIPSNIQERTRSAHEYGMFAPAQLLHNQLKQWSINKGDHDSSV